MIIVISKEASFSERDRPSQFQSTPVARDHRIIEIKKALKQYKKTGKLEW